MITKALRILIVGEYKTGTTALFYKIRPCMPPGTLFLFEPKDPLGDIEKVSPDQAVLTKILFSPGNLDVLGEVFKRHNKHIFIVRDPRDAIISQVLWSSPELHYQDKDKIYKIYHLLKGLEQGDQNMSVSALCKEIFIGNRKTKVIKDAVISVVKAKNPFIYRYEDMVSGEDAALNQYLGMEVAADPEDAKLVRRVSRTKTFGNWRHWFRASDIACFKEGMQDFLRFFSYDAEDWELVHPQRILPEHGSGYFLKLIDGKRKEKGLPLLCREELDSECQGTLKISEGIAHAEGEICGNLDREMTSLNKAKEESSLFLNPKPGSVVSRDNATPKGRMEKVKVIIHFGMDKTGSSSIQQSLYRKPFDARFYYLDLGYSNSKDAVVSLFGSLERVGRLKKKGATSFEQAMMKAGFGRRLDEQMALAKGKVAILSAKEISTFNQYELASLRAGLLARGASPFVAMGYIRPIKSFAESHFQEALKLNFRGAKWSEISRFFPRYRHRFEPFDKIFGRDNVQLLKFDPSLFPKGDVVLDFCSRIGMTFPPERSVRMNEGLSLDAVRFLYVHNMFKTGDGSEPRMDREQMLLQKSLYDLKGSKFYLHSRIVRPILEERKEDIAWMNARLGVSLQEDLTRDDEGAVTCEEDFLRFSPASLDWLRKQLGTDYLGALKTLDDIARAVGLLRQKLVREVPPLNQEKKKSSMGLASDKGRGDVVHIPSRRIIFTHVPRTAGTLIRMMLYFNVKKKFPQMVKHVFIPGYEGVLCERTVKDIELKDMFVIADHSRFPEAQDVLLGRDVFSFTFLRDPVDMLVSHFYRFLKGKPFPRSGVIYDDINKLSNDDFKLLCEAYGNVTISFFCGKVEKGLPVVLRYQSALMNLKRYDFVGTQENLEQDIKIVFDRIGFDVPTLREVNLLLKKDQHFRNLGYDERFADHALTALLIDKAEKIGLSEQRIEIAKKILELPISLYQMAREGRLHATGNGSLRK
ncbi:MAG: sulfotransferase family 2 domain-containing protein [Candidatus Omnitrophica bacterium]|nr:sulfotransferase family 2 domain-containing protein [Candidatus Omnitrophota bacterium]